MHAQKEGDINTHKKLKKDILKNKGEDSIENDDDEVFQDEDNDVLNPMESIRNENNDPNFDESFENNAQMGNNNEEEDNNDNQENIIKNEGNDDELLSVLCPVDNPTCERHISNMKELIFMKTTF